MKRDMELVRKILLEIEKQPFTMGPVTLDIPDYSHEDVSYQLRIMSQAGLVEVIDCSSGSGFDLQPTGLTWTGHEFLDASRDEGRWQQAVQVMKAKGGGLMFDVLKELLTHLIRTSVFGS